MLSANANQNPEQQRAIFVDDDANLLTSTKRILRSLNYTGWEVSFHENPLVAEAIIGNIATDLMVTDMQMPGIDGSHLIYRLRDASIFPVIFILTGQADESSLARSFGYAHRVIRKPCPVEELRSICENVQRASTYITSRELRSFILKRMVSFLRTGVPEPFLSALRRNEQSTLTDLALHDRRCHLFTRYIAGYFGICPGVQGEIPHIVSHFTPDITEQVLMAVSSECRLVERLSIEEVAEHFADPVFPFLGPVPEVGSAQLRDFFLSIWNQSF